jgi:uncharacterized protein DUF2846
MRYLIVLLFITGCAYPKKTSNFSYEKPQERMAVVYLYRVDSQIDSLNPEVPKFFINDTELGKLLLGGYYVKHVPPGDVVIKYKESIVSDFFAWMFGSKREISFKAESNKSYCAKFAIESVMRITYFQLVSDKQCEQEIKSTFQLIN